MMGKPKELPIPPEAAKATNGFEIARIWVGDNSQHVSLMASVWKDPAAWGTALVNLAKRIADAYHKERGSETSELLSRIREGFDAEWEQTTGESARSFLNEDIYNHIRSDQLKVEDIPRSRADWLEFSIFALRFDPKVLGRIGYGKQVTDLNNATSDSSINELRAHLYVEQRRWNHFGRDPDYRTTMKLREILDLIREKLKSADS